MILSSYIATQIRWSRKTFGDGRRTAGLIKHIMEELYEIDDAPLDLEEWVDVMILAFDGAWRAGHSPAEIEKGLLAKQAKNRDREWPDYRDFSEGQPIEHIRSGEGSEIT